MTLSSSRRRPGPTVRVRVHELTAQQERRHEDRLAPEEPLELPRPGPDGGAGPALAREERHGWG